MKVLIFTIAAIFAVGCASTETKTLSPADKAQIDRIEAPCKKDVDKFLVQAKTPKPKIEGLLPSQKVAPKIPSGASASGCTGVVFDIDSQGRADNFRVVAEHPKNEAFREETLKTLMQWQYEDKNVKNHSVVFSFRPTVIRK